MQRNVELAKLVGDELHDALQAAIEGLGETTVIRELDRSSAATEIEYYFPQSSPVPLSRIDAMKMIPVKRRRVPLRAVGVSRGRQFDIAYAPEIDTLYVGRR